MNIIESLLMLYLVAWKILFGILDEHNCTKLVFGSLSPIESTFKTNKMSGVNKTSYYLLKGGQKYENQGQGLTFYMCIKWSYILRENKKSIYEGNTIYFVYENG